jgi:hypothetical protein
VCKDDEFSSSGKGILFKNCLNCLQKSDATWEKESDVFWFLCKSRWKDIFGRELTNTVIKTTFAMPLTSASTLTPMR